MQYEYVQILNARDVVYGEPGPQLVVIKGFQGVSNPAFAIIFWSAINCHSLLVVHSFYFLYFYCYLDISLAIWGERGNYGG